MTYLSELSIEHFRGFLAKQTVSFALPNEQPGSGLTILVGPNNVGKSTVIEALRHVISPPGLVDRNERHLDNALRISIRDTATGYREITNPGLSANIAASGSAHPRTEIFRFIPSRRPWAPRTNTHTIESKQYWIQRTHQTRNEDAHLISRLNSFPPEEKVAFNQALRRLVPQLLDWKIEYSDGHTYLEYVTINGAAHTANLFGEGIASLFRIVLALYDPDESFVVIDEPELSLHPQAQKRLAKFISAQAAHRQIVLCSHSPHFINWADLAAGAAVYRLRQDRYGIHLHRLSDDTIAMLNKLVDDWQKPQLLDTVAREVFFADEALFLEGQEDVSLLGRFIEVENLPQIQLFGYGTGGSRNFRSFLSMAADLHIPSGAIFDRTSKGDYDKIRATFPGVRLELLQADDIRDKPATSERRSVEGVFSRAGDMKSEFRDYLIGLLREFRDYFDDASRP
ncbi:AAA family ATPase [Bradyrhizobium sediminis]|uniref:AAA family ATPase n=1 Tax=Bradyrhizobium sediminis TaxID=2840469 RepID=A0A975NUV7_9BRAD|nr:AAA family ATPase [Bradyrhizobium sediminis]QWG21460.1 AAA family ATPase [Bradyrhizobium sediminis]